MGVVLGTASAKCDGEKGKTFAGAEGTMLGYRCVGGEVFIEDFGGWGVGDEGVDEGGGEVAKVVGFCTG